MLTLYWLTAFPGQTSGRDDVFVFIDTLFKWTTCCNNGNHFQGHEHPIIWIHGVLWSLGFRWIGLPELIVRDKDTHLTASDAWSSFAALQARLPLSVAHHPRTDGQSEVFNRILRQLLRQSVSRFCAASEVVIPACLFTYHNTFNYRSGAKY
jgi:hypothetical protein